VVAHAVDLLIRPGPGPRYHPYPYADSTDPEPFQRSGRVGRRRFGAVTGTWFADAARGATLGAGQVTVEGANGPYHASLEYALYLEPTRTDTDYLHLVRAGFGAVPRLGDSGYMRFGVGARVLVLDDGDAAVGPELELGAQLFPVRPWGVSVLARGALINWSWTGGSPFADLTATGSYFTGRYELLAGWRYTKVGSAVAFSGPAAGVRLWF
jgi:hypothetical protein